MSDEPVETEPQQEPVEEPPAEPQKPQEPEKPQEPQEPPKRGRGRPRKDPNVPPKPRPPRKAPVEKRQVAFAEEEEEPVFYEGEQENVDDIEEEIHTLARMIMQHEREQRANALSKYDRLLGFA